MSKRAIVKDSTSNFVEVATRHRGALSAMSVSRGADEFGKQSKHRERKKLIFSISPSDMFLDNVETRVSKGHVP